MKLFETGHLEKEIVASIIAKDQAEFEQRWHKISPHVKRIQLDIMDHEFVANRSLDFDFKVPDKDHFVEAHLMIKNPEKWIKKNAKKVQMVIIHLESVDRDVAEAIVLAQKQGAQVALAINPETPETALEEYIPSIDQVLILTVHPGYYGSRYIPEMQDKVKYLRKNYPDLDIEVDGGIVEDNIKHIHDVGANRFVIGSFLQKSHHVDRTVHDLKKKAGII